MDKTLVVVDMQEGFSTAHKKETLNECKNLIRFFIKHQLPIIVLEYNQFNNGKTIQEISKLYENYPYVKVLKKRKDDGSDQVHRFMKREHWGITKNDEVVVCGVNIKACVYETVWGLLAKGYKVVAVKKACNCYYYRGGNRTWTDNFPVKRSYSIRCPDHLVGRYQQDPFLYKCVKQFRLIDTVNHI